MSHWLPTFLSITHASGAVQLSLAAISFASDWPWWLWAVLVLFCVLVLTYTYRRIWLRTHQAMVWWLLGLRIVGVMSLLLMMAGPLWITTKSQTHKPTLMLVMDDSASMTLPASVDDVTDQSSTSTSTSASTSTQHLTRLDVVRQSFNATAVRQLLESRFDVMTQSLDGSSISQAQTSAVIDADAPQTDLLRALQLAANRGRNHAAQGVILVSDGSDTTHRSDWLALSNYPLPVYTLGFAQQPVSKKQIELAITQAQAPVEVHAHHTVSIKLTINAQGVLEAPLKLPITLSLGDKPLASTTTMLPTGKGTSHDVTLDFMPDEPGDFVLTLRVPVQPGEKNRQDNQRQIRLRVNNEPIRVFYLEGQLRPEFTFLKARLTNDPDINLITFVRTGNTDELGSNLVTSEMLSKDGLREIDVILIGDFESTMLSPDAWQAIASWINDGGGLMVLGGYHNLGTQGLRNTAISNMLPVTLNSPQAGQQLDEPFSFTPTIEAVNHPALKLSDQPAADINAWSSMAALSGIVTTGLSKPAADVLVRHPRGPDGKVGQGFVVLATQLTGQGRTAILTADTTWRWSRIARLAGQPDTYYARFWSQMIRYLAKRPADLSQQPLTISSDAQNYQPGQRVTLQIRRNYTAVIPGNETSPNAMPAATSAAPAATENITLQVHRDQKRIAQLVAKPSSTPGQWSAEYYPDRHGQYDVTAALSIPTASHESRIIASAATSWFVQGATQEFDDASPNPQLMQQIAQLTQGRYVDLSNTQNLLSLLSDIPAAAAYTQQTTRHTLWNNPIFFLVFLTCVSIEWMIRRRHRLM